ncbi:hypothetical protein CLV84_3860 [Neolewinella xylanilytica]|uniref:Uncharacterized protein n=1 Tax=Neolewinella xylanilytica TaxID=1514080 RepID=A0A2S6I151_9BACT|nr:hypothetical protein CLV84_3860 [Neolewinella xylanilytica]
MLLHDLYAYPQNDVNYTIIDSSADRLRLCLTLIFY